MAELRNKDELLKVLDQCCDTAYNCGSVTVSRDDIIELHFFVTCILRERDELREVVDGFMDFVPTCTYCDGKTADGERTEHCLYDIDYNESLIYCGKKAIELYSKLKSDLASAQAEICRLKFKMSYMTSPNTIGDSHEMGAW